MDNETSKDVEDFIASQQTDQQYTPPDMHQGNPAERSIQTYKSCIKSAVAYLPPKFPIKYWCRLIQQVEFIINIVRKCRQNPLLSSWAAVDPLLTVGTARRVPRVNNTDEGQTAAAGQRWTGALKHRLSAHY